MSRTMFVNPSFVNPRKRRSKKKSRRGRRRGARYSMRGRVTLARRNAGIAPFAQQNPLILSNPRKRRRRQSNPIQLPSLKKSLDSALSYGGGAALALTVNTVGTSRITHTWGRRGAQLAVSVVGGSMLANKSPAMGGAFAGATMYALLQDVAADLFGIGFAAGSSSKEADLDALAADLEDVLDDMDGSESSDDESLSSDDGEEEYAW